MTELTLGGGVVVGVTAFVAAAINAAAGGGSFISFPAMLAVGLPPINANATNNTAMWLGAFSSAGELRSELDVPRATLIKMLAASTVGSVAGALLLLRTSNAAFTQLIPILLFVATAVFVAGPAITRAARSTRGALTVDSPLGVAAQTLIALYGGFFGAAIGILMLALLGILGMQDIRRANAFKVLLSTIINGAAVVPFALAHAILVGPAIVACACAIAGGFLGARVVKRLPPLVVRRFVIAVACTMTAYFAVRTYVLPHA